MGLGELVRAFFKFWFSESPDSGTSADTVLCKSDISEILIIWSRPTDIGAKDPIDLDVFSGWAACWSRKEKNLLLSGVLVGAFLLAWTYLSSSLLKFSVEFSQVILGFFV